MRQEILDGLQGKVVEILDDPVTKPSPPPTAPLETAETAAESWQSLKERFGPHYALGVQMEREAMALQSKPVQHAMQQGTIKKPLFLNVLHLRFLFSRIILSRFNS